MEIRETGPDDRPALQALYPAAFPDEDLLGLVAALLDDPAAAALSLGAADGALIGHALFTAGRLDAPGRRAVLLGPVAVDPARQGGGVGSALIRHGCQILAQAGVDAVFVLGDPAWYGRFGFQAETGVAPPYPLAPEHAAAWQSLSLTGNAPPPGRFHPAEPWMAPALWLS